MKHRIPLPVERSLYSQYVQEQAVRDIGFDRGARLELLGAYLTISLPYPCNYSRICVLWERDPRGAAHCYRLYQKA